MGDSALAPSKLKARSIRLPLLQVDPAKAGRTPARLHSLGFCSLKPPPPPNNPGLPVMRWPIRVDDKGLNKCLDTRLSVGAYSVN